jgi:hypothetical protein
MKLTVASPFYFENVHLMCRQRWVEVMLAAVGWHLLPLQQCLPPGSLRRCGYGSLQLWTAVDLSFTLEIIKNELRGYLCRLGEIKLQAVGRRCS